MTSTAAQPMVDADRVALLAATVTGPVLVPGDEGFAQECAGFNLLVAHRPVVVVGATDAFDVQAAVRFAVANDLPVAVKNTGHQPFYDVAGCVLITLSRMDSVDVDPVHGLARVGGGARWHQVVSSASAHGLAALNGSSPDVGVVGYTLGGGFSPIMGRTYGWAADHVRAVEIVTADGRLRRVTPYAERDLFWAVRGGKSNFGVVTALEFDLFEVARIYGGGLYFDGAHTAAVLHAYRELVATAPKELNSSVGLLRMPPLPSVPELLRGRLVVHVRISYLGAESDGERLVAPLRAVAPPIIDTVADMPYADNASVHQDPTDPLPYRERSALLSELTEELVDVIVGLVGPDSGADITLFEIRQMAGALARPASVPNAVGNREAGFTMLGGGAGTPEDIEPQIALMEKVIATVAPWSTEHKYLNFIGGEDDVETAYEAATYRRLRGIKTAYDPDNVFRMNNHNIPPM